MLKTSLIRSRTPRALTRNLLMAAATLGVTAGLSACNLVYKLPVQQGNIIATDDAQKLRPGMTPSQVEFVMGTALIQDDIAAGQRWDYVSYYQNPRGHETLKTVTVFFDDGVVTRIEGVATPNVREEEEIERASVEEAREQASERKRDAQRLPESVDRGDAEVLQEIKQRDDATQP